ncbi:glycosyl transferase [Pseudomonas sp. MWU12-2534b]|nr:glycosyl transferase [Pseudomonas sp. MWU12-2534b]
MTIWLLFGGAALASLLLTGLFRRYALARSLMDVPNERSSHSVPTPRGGGLSIVICFLVALPYLVLSFDISWSHIWSLLGAGALVTLVGFLDDHGHIAARWRLLSHFAAAVFGVSFLSGIPSIDFLGSVYSFGWLGYVFFVLYLVWLLNLYNFMDGIDGIASVEAVCVCFGVCLIYWILGDVGLIGAPLLLATSVLGFLYWNFPPARIFMGDAGSGFLGITMGLLSLQAALVSPHFFWVWLILLGVFIVDATLTLLVRMLRGDKVYEAHRSHAYQFASRQVGAHLPVTLVVMVINLLWLLPIAICVGLLGLDGIIGVTIAYIPLIFIAYKFRAGRKE